MTFKLSLGAGFVALAFAAAAAGGPGARAAADTFGDLDTNNDDALSLDEVRFEDEVRPHFAALDSDGNGLLSKGEFAAVEASVRRESRQFDTLPPPSIGGANNSQRELRKQQ